MKKLILLLLFIIYIKLIYANKPIISTEDKINNVLQPISLKNSNFKKISKISKNKFPIIENQKKLDKIIQIAFDPFAFSRGKENKSWRRFNIFKYFKPIDCNKYNGERIYKAENNHFKYKISKIHENIIVLTPGFGNISPSLEFVLRLLKIGKKVIIIYQNPGKNNESWKLREATHFGPNNDYKLPSKYAKKLYIIGEDHRILLDHEQATDVVIDAYRIMYENQKLLGFNVLESKSIFIGHSLGSITGPYARKILTENGYPNAIGTLFTIGGVLGVNHVRHDAGSATQINMVGKLMNLVPGLSPSAKRLGDFLNGMMKGKHNKFLDELIKFVDYGFAGRIGPYMYQIENYVRPQYRLAANGMSVLDMYRNPIDTYIRGLKAMIKGGVFGYIDAFKANQKNGADTDGSVPVVGQLQGTKRYIIREPVDHLYEISLYSVVDDMFNRFEVGGRNDVPDDSASKPQDNRRRGFFSSS